MGNENNWIVITGGPSSGKTTILDALKEKGYTVVYEAARFYIDDQLKKGKTLEKIRKNELAFQKKILRLKVAWEKAFDKEKLLFLERGIGDSVAYYKTLNAHNDKELLKAVSLSSYKKVFLLELGFFEKDYARTENEEEAKKLESLLEDSYRQQNIEVIRVPFMAVEKRVKYILNNVPSMQSFDFTTYVSPFTWRYGSLEMRKLFSEQHKYELWRKIWVALAAFEHKAGLVSREELTDLQKHQNDIDIGRILVLEKETKHDVVAAIREFSEKAKLGGGKIHLGATSMDIVDNAEMMRTREAILLIERNFKELLRIFSEKILEYADFPCMGYTHLQAAEPTTVGYRLALYGQDLLMDVTLLQSVKPLLKGKGMKGAVGTRASYTEILRSSKFSASKLDAFVSKELGIESITIASQVYPRKIDYFVSVVLTSIASTIAKFASDIRILQSAGFSEWGEPFGKTQVGSSAMPFKRNPIQSEKICSLARFVSTLPGVALENATLSHLERTLDDSANRRVTIPEGFLAIDEILLTAQKLVTGLIVDKKRIAMNLFQFGPFAATESILISLVKKGANRQEMHELLRTISLKAWEAVQEGKPNPIRSLLVTSSIIGKRLTSKEIDMLLDVTGHIGDAPERAKKIAQEMKKVSAGTYA